MTERERHIWIGAVVVAVVMALFPPWETLGLKGVQYAPAWDPPNRGFLTTIEPFRLVLQWAVVGAGAFVLTKVWR